MAQAQQDDLARLDEIRVEVQQLPAVADEKTREEIQDLKSQEAEARLSAYKQDTAERKIYANRIYCLVVGWVAAMFVVLFLQGFRWGGWSPLADNVLIALVGGSTASIFGIFAVVARYIFRVAEK